MPPDVFIISSSMIKVGRYFELSYKELAKRVIDQVLEDVHVDSVDYVVVSSMLSEVALLQLDISTILMQHLGEVPVRSVRVETGESSGLAAIEYAYYLVKSGRASNVLVVGVEKATEYPTNVTNDHYKLILDYELETIRNIAPPNYAALIMKKYMKLFNVSREDLTSWPVKMHQNAVNNPYAQLRFPITPDKVLSSIPVSEPIRLLDTFPIGDGAAAVLISSKQCGPYPVRIAEIAAATSMPVYLRDDITELPATKAAFNELMSKFKIDLTETLIELHDSYSIYGYLILETLGLSPKGKAWEVISNLSNVNLSGGLKARGHPFGATGVYQVVEAHKLLTEGLGNMRFNGRYALVHSMSGPDYNARMCLLER